MRKPLDAGKTLPTVRVCCGFVLLALLVPAAGAGKPAASAPSLLDLRVGNGGAPFAGDRRLLATVSPNADGSRDSAVVSFRLRRAALVQIEAVRTETFRVEPRFSRVVWSTSADLAPGWHRFVWKPSPSIELRTYILRLTVSANGAQHVYGSYRPGLHPRVDAPVVRMLGVSVSSGQRSYAPGNAARVQIATDARNLRLQVLGFRQPPQGAVDALTGASPVGPAASIDWRGHRNAPHAVEVRGAADLPTGLYFFRATAGDGRVGYAPFVVRPRPAARHRVAVVLSTNTWQAYNFEDANGDGWGDSWYVSSAIKKVGLSRAYVGNGVPRHFRELSLPFEDWLASTGRQVDTLAEDDLERVSGDVLAARYDLIVFPGHEEYVTPHVYAAVERYRDLGGNLIFLSADNFFRRVDRRGSTIVKGPAWRDAGAPEAALVGVQFLNSDHCDRQGAFVVSGAEAVPWVFAGTGLRDGDRFGSYGCEIDALAPSSPAGTIVLATIPDLFAPGHSAQMTYYETPTGAKVFAAGALNFVGSVGSAPASQLLENLWLRLSRP
jgi:hypothetical protein